MGLLQAFGYIKVSKAKQEIAKYKNNAKQMHKVNQKLLAKMHDMEKTIQRQELEIETYNKLLGESKMKNQETEKSLELAKKVMKESSMTSFFSGGDVDDE